MIFVPFSDGQPAGTPEHVLTGFVSADGFALDRPVGVAVDHVGNNTRDGKSGCYCMDQALRVQIGVSFDMMVDR